MATIIVNQRTFKFGRYNATSTKARPNFWVITFGKKQLGFIKHDPESWNTSFTQNSLISLTMTDLEAITGLIKRIVSQKVKEAYQEL